MAHYKFIPIQFFSSNILEPEFRQRDLEMHYSEFYLKDTDKLNIALDGYGELHNIDIRELMQMRRLPATIKDDILYYGGSFIAHGMYFEQFKKKETCKGFPVPGEPLMSAIKNVYRTYEEFLYSFSSEAEKICGSGFCWLTVQRNGIAIESTYGYELPRGKIIIAIDMWEHAYVQRYGSNKKAYTDACFRHMNYSVCEKRFSS